MRLSLTDPTFDSKSTKLTALSSTWRIMSWVHTLPLASNNFSFLIPSSTVIIASFRSRTKVVKCWWVKCAFKRNYGCNFPYCSGVPLFKLSASSNANYSWVKVLLYVAEPTSRTWGRMFSPKCHFKSTYFCGFLFNTHCHFLTTVSSEIWRHILSSSRYQS